MKTASTLSGNTITQTGLHIAHTTWPLHKKRLIGLQLAGLAALALICFLSNSAILMKARERLGASSPELTTDCTGGSQLRWPRPPPCSSAPFSAGRCIRNLHSTDKETAIWLQVTHKQNHSQSKVYRYNIYQSIPRDSQSYYIMIMCLEV